MPPITFQYSDVSVQPFETYRVWCSACHKWISEKYATPHEPALRVVADLHREKHARGKV